MFVFSISVLSSTIFCFIPQVSNCVLNVRLKNPDWKSTLLKELDLCSMNTEALYTPGSSTLLGDDINMTDTSEFSMEGKK